MNPPPDRTDHPQPAPRNLPPRRPPESPGLPRLAVLDRLVGYRLPGGCGQCNADTRYTREADTGVYVATVLHDDRCPTWRRIQRAHAPRRTR